MVDSFRNRRELGRGIARQSFNLAAMDSANNNVRIRQGALVLRGDTASNNASVVYFLNGQFFRATAKAVIFAGQSHTARTACAQLLSSSQPTLSTR